MRAIATGGLAWSVPGLGFSWWEAWGPALAVSALQLLKFGTLSLHLSVPAPVLIFRRHLKTYYCQQAFQPT